MREGSSGAGQTKNNKFQNKFLFELRMDFRKLVRRRENININININRKYKIRGGRSNELFFD